MPPSPFRLSNLSTLFWSASIHAMFAVTGLIGLAAIVSGLPAMVRGELPLVAGIMVMLTGCIALAVGVGFFYLTYIASPRKEAAERRITALYPDQPWMLRKDWAAGRVVDRSGLAVAIFMGVWCAGWWGAMALIWTVNREKIIAAVQQSWGEGLLIGVFVLGGVAGLAVLFGALRTWWIYGHATLRIDTLPGYLGDAFRGSVTVRLPVKPKGPIDVTLVCEDVLQLRRRKAGGGHTIETTYDELWSESIPVEPGRLLMTRGTTTIPVDIAIPNAQPECALDDNGNGTRWVLRVHGLIEGRPGFSFQFEVPVYRRR